MPKLKRLLLLLVVVLICISFDQASKSIAKRSLAGEPPREYLAGGVGNLIDRLTHGGRVVDFMQLRAGPLRTGVFNVADVALMVGIGLVLLALLFERNPESSSV